MSKLVFSVNVKSYVFNKHFSLQPLFDRQHDLHDARCYQKEPIFINFISNNRPQSPQISDSQDWERTSEFRRYFGRSAPHQQETEWTDEIWTRGGVQYDLYAEALRNYQRRVQERESLRREKTSGETNVNWSSCTQLKISLIDFPRF